MNNGWGSYNIALYFIFLCIVAAIGIIVIEKPKYNAAKKVTVAEQAPATVN